MGKPSAPPPPDYAALARAQGEESRDTAIYNNAINRVNQVGPDGSITWSVRPGANPDNPQPGDYIQTTSLSPQQQAIKDAQYGINRSFLDTAQSGIGRVADAMAGSFNTQGLPGLRTVNASGQPAVAGVNPGQTPVSSVGTTPLQTSLNRSGLPGLDYGTADSRKRVEDAMMSRISPELDRQQTDLDTRLLNSGIEKGSAAWEREQARFGQQRNDALMQVQMAGGQEESRLSDLQRAQRAQLFGEEATAGSFGNTAQGQMFQQGLAAGSFANTAQDQAFARALQSGQFANSAQYQAIAQAIQAAQQANQTRGQGIQEQAFLRQLPINEINALRTGAQVSAPQFGSYYTGGTAQAAPIFDAGMAQGNYDMNAYQQSMAGYNALLGGLAGMGGAFLGTL